MDWAVAAVLIAVVFLSFALLTVTDMMSIAYLTLGSFIIGTMFAFHNPASQTFVVSRVPSIGSSYADHRPGDEVREAEDVPGPGTPPLAVQP